MDERREELSAKSTVQNVKISEAPILDGKVNNEDSHMEIDQPEGSMEEDDHRQVKEKNTSENSVEQKRGRRMFGALLGTLGKFQQESEREQKSARKVKRAELEEKLAKRREQELQELEKQEKIEAEILESRLQEQRKVALDELELDRNDLKKVLDNKKSYYLRTKTQPSLFYRPYYLLPSQRTQLEQMKSEAP
ncbi:EJC auxiliary factor, pinin ortholog Pnn1 [Schizosaccharomyces pombe]